MSRVATKKPLLNKQGLCHLWRLFRLRDEAPATIPRLPERFRLYIVCRQKFLHFSCRVCCSEASPAPITLVLEACPRFRRRRRNHYAARVL